MSRRNVTQKVATDYTGEAPTAPINYVVIRVEPGRTCACGCEQSINPKARFRQGHDQRLIGMLAHVVVTGQQVGVVTGEDLWIGSAREYGVQVLSDAGAYKLEAAISNARTRLYEVRTVVVAPVRGDRVKVRVGRWDYDADVYQVGPDGAVTAVRYVTRSGASKVTDQFALVS